MRSSVLILAACLWSGLALAGNPDSRFDISPDGARVDFDVQDVSRRDVLDRLLADTGIEVRWISSSFGDERISGKFSGPRASVARQLLAQANFVLVHGDGDQTSRVVRVVVVGPARGEQSSAALAALTAAVQPMPRPVHAPTGEAARPPAHGPMPLSESTPSGDVAGALKPPSPGATLPLAPSAAEAPRLVPPPPDMALPLTPVRPGSAAPRLVPP
jgi:hypothetical protein